MAQWKPITLTEAKTFTDRPICVYTSCAFDLFHSGHVGHLRQIKEAIPNAHLVVAVCTDEDVKLNKGFSPVVDYANRSAVVANCKWVDAILHPPFPYRPTVAFIDKMQFDLVAYNNCYAGIFDEFCKLDRFLGTRRQANISTTGILASIVMADNPSLAEWRTRVAARQKEEAAADGGIV